MTATIGVSALALLASVLLLRVVASVLADEAKGWLVQLGRALLGSAARRLPESQRDRWSEEWMAEHEAKRDRPITALVFAASIRWHAGQMATALGPKHGEATARAISNGRVVDEDLTQVRHAWQALEPRILVQILELLDYRERRILELHFGLGGEDPRTLDEIGRTFAVSGDRIAQIERQAMMKVASLAEAQKLRDVA
jgi:Sigma-70, region 4